MPGLHFEEFDVGQTFDRPIRRTVTEADNMLFSVMTMKPQPLHIDAEFAAHSEFGQRLVNSLCKSRPDAGIVEVERIALNQRDELVAICRRNALTKRAARPAGA